MTQPSFAVIVPNYNHARYLPAALDAILAQSLQPREIRVIDDASTDDSRAVIADYAARHPHIRPVLLERNRGVEANMNAALAEATEDYLFYAAADDVVLPGLFERSLALLSAHPEAGLCSAQARMMHPDGGDLGPYVMTRPLATAGYIAPQRARELLMADDSWMIGNTTMWRRAALIECGGFRRDLLGLADGYVSRLLAARFGACFIPEDLAYWRRDERGVAGQTMGDFAKVLAIGKVVERAMREPGAPFAPGYAARWHARWLSSALTPNAADRPITTKLRQALPRLAPIDRLALPLLDALRCPRAVRLYGFLRLRPYDMLNAARRRLLPRAKGDEALKRVDSHYAFGKNWDSFSGLIDEHRFQVATDSLRQLSGLDSLAGKRFLDIGCGSGLFSAAALRLGAGPLRAVDIDPDSVRTTERTLSALAPGGGWTVAQRSVFDMTPAADGLHDIVYSWGVLHHTGAMHLAIANASRLVAPGGMFIIGLYKKTPFCGAWRVEKRLYTHGPRWLAAILRGLYKAAYLGGIALTGRSPKAYVAAYSSNRGMNWHHDIEDWLGGYPYESVSDAEMAEIAAANGFRIVRSNSRAVPAKGLLGTVIAEFVLERP